MTLPAVPSSISFSQLSTEYFGSSTNIKLSDYYYGGNLLQKNTCTDAVRSLGDAFLGNSSGFTAHFKNVPETGSISMSAFRGKTYYYAKQTVTNVSGDDQSVNSTTIEDEALRDNSENSAYFVVTTTGNCKATSTSNTGLTITNANRGYTTCYLNNSNKIWGKGGAGGKGQSNGSNGKNGGTSIRTGTHLIINNNDGRILGGGGGGGGGAVQRISYKEGYCSTSNTNFSIGGSGGGGGAGGGAGGAKGDPQPANFTSNSNGNGSAGTYDDSNAGGNGGSGCGYNRVLGTVCSYTGGNGGTWGTDGNGGPGPGTGGGSGGKSIRYKDGKNVHYVIEGTVAGSTQAYT